MEQTPRQLARIAVDLGTEDLDNTNAAGRTRLRTPLRGKKPDFCALFAADGLRQLDTYLAKWAAYDDYIARRSHISAARQAALLGVDDQSQMPTIRLEMLLLRAIDSYESRHGTDPTVVELAADLGIPPDFGHSQLVRRLRHQVSAGFVSHYRGRISLTAAGREMVEDDTAASQSPQQAELHGEHTPSEAALNRT